MSRKMSFVILFAVLVAALLAGCGPINQRLLDGTAVASGQSLDSPLSEPLDLDLVVTMEITVDISATETQAALDAIPTETEVVTPTDTIMPTPEIPTDTPDATFTPTLSDDQAKLTALAETLLALESGTPTTEPTIELDETATETPEGPTATPGPTEVPCLAMRFINHVTYPLYATVQPNTLFYKSWYVQNVGSCTWNGEFAIVHYDGLQMNGPTPTYLGANVAVPPGDFVTITIPLWTGPQTGDFSSYWLMSDDNGVLFGGGPEHNQPLVVIVHVPGDSPPEFTQPASTAPPFYTPTP